MVLLLSWPALACGVSRSRPDAAPGGGDAAARAQVFAPWNTREVDMLFMIDNSGSMTGAQQRLIANFPEHMNVLRSLPGGMPSVHIGVVSSDLGAGNTTDVGQCRPLGDGGRLQFQPRIPGCQGPRDHFINVSEGERVKNYDGTIEEAFACIASLGESGCAFEHQLKSAAVALGFDGAIPPENAGFLRPKAHLAVIFLSDEDDCSAPADSQLFDPTQRELSDPLGPLASYRCNEFGHLCGGQRPPRIPPQDGVELTDCHSAEDGTLIRVSELAAFFKSLKRQPGMVTMAAIVGPRNPYRVRWEARFNGSSFADSPAVAATCSTSEVAANPAIRIADFIDEFGQNGLLLPICAAAYVPALNRIAEEVSLPNPPRCLQANVIGGTSANPDLASGCQVFHYESTTGGPIQLTPLPKCASASPPAGTSCWTVEDNPSCNGVPELKVSWDNEAPDDHVVSVRCE